MKNKIFERMIKYGWNLGDNTTKDFEAIYNIHYNFINDYYDYISNWNTNDLLNFNNISINDFNDVIVFLSDFLRALNELDKELKQNEKQK